MGIFRTTIGIAAVERPDDRRDIEVMVDTGSEYNWIPKTLLEDLGIDAYDSERFQTADGHVFERPVGFALLYIGARMRATMVVFAEEGDMVLLGAIGLQTFNLRVDLVTKQLVPAGPVPVANLETIGALCY